MLVCFGPMAAIGFSVSPRVKRLAPFFIAGPISGPLLAGVVFNFKEGRPVLGSLYAIALVLWTLLLPVLVVKTAQQPIHQMIAAGSHHGPHP